MEDVEIALISDLHYGFPKEKDMSEYLDTTIENMVQEINDSDADFVVLLGDLIEHSDREKDLKKLEKIGEQLQEIKQDVYAIPGNHDAINVSKEEFVEKLDVKNSEPNFSFKHKNRKFIFLDTVAKIDGRYDTGLIGSEQRDWLKQEMDADKEKILFTHHLIHYHDNLEDNWFFTDKPELATCLDKHLVQEVLEEDTRAVFSAHIHQATLKEYREVPYFTTSSIDKFNPPEKFEKNHAFVRFTEDKVEFNTQGKELVYQR